MKTETKKLLEKLYFLSTTENSSPEEIKAIEETLMDTIKVRKLDVYKFSDADSELNGAYMDPEGYAVATDAMQLLACKECYKEEFKGKTINKKKEVTGQGFTTWRRLVPKTEGKNFRIRSYDEIKLDLIKCQAYNYYNFKGHYPEFMFVKIAEGFWINASRVENFLSCLKAGYIVTHKAKQITLRHGDSVAMFSKSYFDNKYCTFAYSYMEAVETF